MSTLAVFLALGGIGYAAITIPKNSVGKKQLKKNAVVSKKVKNRSLLKKDFKSGQLPAGATGPQGPVGPAGPTGATGAVGPATGAAGGDLTGTYPDPQIAANAVTGAEVDESTLSGVDATTLSGAGAGAFAGIGRQAAEIVCLDDNHLAGGDLCGSVAMTLPRPQRVLLLASGEAVPGAFNDLTGPGSGADDTNKVRGTCKLAVDGTVVEPGRTMSLGDAVTIITTTPYALETVTGVLAAGAHSFQLRCFEEDGDLDWSRNLITAVALAAD
jgi:hypothetical protein